MKELNRWPGDAGQRRQGVKKLKLRCSWRRDDPGGAELANRLANRSRCVLGRRAAQSAFVVIHFNDQFPVPSSRCVWVARLQCLVVSHNSSKSSGGRTCFAQSCTAFHRESARDLLPRNWSGDTLTPD